ncbi:putative MFS family arabinose efflux permease [Paraburkholderia caballeronis]|uniref:Predicted arabinose efflux permease, MFS family n=2 Tax=Paraburkholderia caballeronis TaxID=416943 RepID=A0A1H7US28_9BURK|nr:putative MFS family arabinose efflux permease [Paraburkholderia caballeronis]PXX02204.1 putative MFS family arabinose efflux permease [Paraburkholderia caballeronis]RAK01361.1 putative MFS family arabinose efflux permease [Paraburkholderia caballeronis]TDV25887.1 putative MFS family arabinose efflux permease [Paraburkholderia caballeronis]SEL99616.1 Predicted arabinose efflux permease, MFS family [Paraburkholderia caballeronis]
MYDFMVYGYYASAIAKTYFPSDSAFASLMLSLSVFGAGFLVRPIGAIVLGAYIDHHGRRKGLILTLGLMALGTLAVAVVPGYATIGMLAPLLVLCGRLLQGFSAGVELGGVSVYLSEIATKGNKGFYVSWQSGSQQVAVVFAALLGVVLNRLLPVEQMTSWGWRVPFIIGCLIVPFLFLIRRSLQETEEFASRKHRPSMGEIAKSMVQNWGVVLAGMGMVLMTTVSFYLITAYTPTFGREVLKLDSVDTLVVTLCIGLSNLVWLPLWGAISDRIGRRPVLIAFTVLAILTAYPSMQWLVSDPSFGRLLAVGMWLSFIYGSYNGAMVVALTEVMPRDVRTAGFSLAYSLATTIGGFTPAISTLLIHVSGNKAAPGVWMGIAAICGLIATLVLYRTAEARNQYKAV